MYRFILDCLTSPGGLSKISIFEITVVIRENFLPFPTAVRFAGIISDFFPYCCKFKVKNIDFLSYFFSAFYLKARDDKNLHVAFLFHTLNISHLGMGYPACVRFVLHIWGRCSSLLHPYHVYTFFPLLSPISFLLKLSLESLN